MVNFERATYRTTRYLPPDQTVVIWVDRLGVTPSPMPGARIAWVVDSIAGPELTDFLDNGQYPITTDYHFDLSAGSDFAKSDPTSDLGLPTIWPSPEPPDFLPQYQHPPSGIFRGWGELSWGQDDFTSKPILITISNNIMANFNRDFVIRLYPVPGASDNAMIGSIGQTVVTILNNDEYRPSDMAYNTNVVRYDPAGS